jgi:hypothetical protein
MQNFTDFIQSPGFLAFRPKVMPIATAPAAPQIYNTDVSPIGAFSHPLTEVIRIKVGDELNFAKVEKAWHGYVSTLVESLPTVAIASGKSMNIDEQLFIGLVGWNGLEVCIDMDPQAQDANYLLIHYVLAASEHCSR